jgi:hypothetical protein
MRIKIKEIRKAGKTLRSRRLGGRKYLTAEAQRARTVAPTERGPTEDS